MTENSTNRLVAAYRDGYTVGQAARYAGMDRRVAIVMLRRLGVPIRQNNRRLNFIWTEDHDALLREKHEEGISYSLIADALNAQFGTSYSRNAAIGRAHRLGLSRTTPASQCRPRKPRTRQKPMPDTTPNARPLPSGRAEPGRSYSSPDSGPAPLSSEAPPEGRVTDIESLSNNHCRWPTGDPQDSDFSFCGAPADLSAGRPYCEAHARASLAKGERKPYDAYAARPAWLPNCFPEHDEAGEAV